MMFFCGLSLIVLIVIGVTGIWGGIFYALISDAQIRAQCCLNVDSNRTIIQNSTCSSDCDYLVKLQKKNDTERFDNNYWWTWKDAFKKEVHCINFKNSTDFNIIKYKHYC